MFRAAQSTRPYAWRGEQPWPSPRTVTLPTCDRGEVTIPETAHVDLAHDGPEYTLGHDDEPLWVAAIGQSPFASRPEYRGVGVYVEQQHFAATLDPAGLYALAASLDAHADQLAAILAGGGQ
ncbi:DUF6907 domain-containing protein [Streptomyces longwoodensis]|uniref:DUF6907 domain-containing protein n=1 Tax=Streptomyces longwoodensis TaxID=68231 RepID=UPI0037A853BF